MGRHAADLFEPTTVARWAEAYQRLLEALAEEAGQSLGEVALPSPADHALLAQWGTGPADAVPADPDTGGGPWIRVRPSAAAKCVRCWHKRVDVGADASHPELCARCVVNLEGAGESRQFA